MTGHEYLASVLERQTLQDWELKPLQEAREEIGNLLKSNFGWSTRFYYGGSYGKRTMIRLNYDLDIVIYFDSQRFSTLKEMYESVFGVLWNKYPGRTQKKTVAIQISYAGSFHIDVVPARLIEFSDNEANLYRTDIGTSLKTSVQNQVQHVRDSDLRDIMRLMKVWRERHGLEFKSFALELLVIRALTGEDVRGYDNKAWRVLCFIRDNVCDVSLIDPANSNNVISDTIPKKHKEAMRSQAIASLDEGNWGSIIW